MACTENICLSGYPNQSKSRPYLISIFNEKYNYFLRYLGIFRVQMGPGSKIKRSEVRLAPLFQKPLINTLLLLKQFWLQLISNSLYSSFSVVFLLFLTPLFDFRPIFKCYTQGMEKNQINFHM